MGALEEIKRMQREGKEEQNIILSLHNSGFSEKEISEALTQTKIKEAVTAPSATEDMQPSIMDQEQQSAAPMPDNPVEQAPESGEQQYQQYTPYQETVGQPNEEGADYQVQENGQYSQVYSPMSISPDTISEIAEQVMEEKLLISEEKFKQIASFKTSVESKVEYIDERLKKLEKIIDRLQLSILQKVGEYVTNVEDIKKEMIETQKSFKSLVDDKPSKKSSNQNAQSHSSQPHSQQK